MNEDYEYIIFGSWRVMFLILELCFLIPVLAVSLRLLEETITYFILACCIPITAYVLMKVVKNMSIAAATANYEVKYQMPIVWIEYFLHNTIHVTFIIVTEMFLLHSKMHKYKNNWVPFFSAAFFAAFLAACTCFINSMITNCFIVGFTVMTVAGMITIHIYKKVRHVKNGKPLVTTPPSSVKFFGLYLILPYFLNFWHFLLSVVSLVARYNADTEMEFDLYDDSIHAYAVYLVEFRPLTILIPVFITVPCYRNYIRNFIRNFIVSRTERKFSTSPIRPVSAKTI